MHFKKIIYDTQYPDKNNQLHFFSETNQNDESLTLMTEGEIVEWLFKDSSFTQLFYEDFFLNPRNVNPYFGIKEPFTKQGKKPGDIDLLLVDPDFPEQTIVFECKRVKALSMNKQSPKVNGVKNVKKGIVQAEFYKNLGFHQCYLMIILLDDGRYYETPNVMFRITDVEYLSNLYNIPRELLLNEDIGIIFVKVEQTSGKHIKLSGGYGFCIDRHAKHFDQSDLVTNNVKELIKIERA